MEQKHISQKLHAGFIQKAVVEKTGGQWVIELIEENGERFQLTLQRLQGEEEAPRRFASLDAAANAVRRIGFTKFEVRL